MYLTWAENVAPILLRACSEQQKIIFTWVRRCIVYKGIDGENSSELHTQLSQLYMTQCFLISEPIRCDQVFFVGHLSLFQSSARVTCPSLATDDWWSVSSVNRPLVLYSLFQRSRALCSGSNQDHTDSNATWQTSNHGQLSFTRIDWFIRNFGSWHQSAVCICIICTDSRRNHKPIKFARLTFLLM